jgi:hypothetical protein
VEKVNEARKQINVDRCKRLVESMPGSIQKVLEADSRQFKKLMLKLGKTGYYEERSKVVIQ